MFLLSVVAFNVFGKFTSFIKIILYYILVDNIDRFPIKSVCNNISIKSYRNIIILSISHKKQEYRDNREYRDNQEYRYSQKF